MDCFLKSVFLLYATCLIHTSFLSNTVKWPDPHSVQLSWFRLYFWPQASFYVWHCLVARSQLSLWLPPLHTALPPVSFITLKGQRVISAIIITCPLWHPGTTPWAHCTTSPLQQARDHIPPTHSHSYKRTREQLGLQLLWHAGWISLWPAVPQQPLYRRSL